MREMTRITYKKWTYCDNFSCIVNALPVGTLESEGWPRYLLDEFSIVLNGCYWSKEFIGSAYKQVNGLGDKSASIQSLKKTGGHTCLSAYARLSMPSAVPHLILLCKGILRVLSMPLFHCRVSKYSMRCPEHCIFTMHQIMSYSNKYMTKNVPWWQ